MQGLTAADVTRVVNTILQEHNLLDLANRFAYEHHSHRGTHKRNIVDERIDERVDTYIRERVITRIRDKVITPQMYGDAFTGVAGRDSTEAIRRCLAAACTNDYSVYFPDGSYQVTPATGSYAITFPLTKGITIIGAGMGRATIKIKGGVGAWPILFGAISPTDVTDLDVSGLTFDCNTANNHRTRTAAGANQPYDGEWVFSLGPGDNIRIHDNEFTNCASVQVIAMSSSVGNIEGAWIENNLFSNIGDTTTSYDYDSSVIYAHGKYCRICGNTMLSAGVAADGTRTAIETHGDSQYASDNIINDFQKGFNITGVDIVDNHRIIVRENEIYNCKRGIQLWSYKWSVSHETGFGLDGVDVTGNIIQLGTAAGWGNDILFAGVEFPSEGDNELPANNINISNNLIYTDLPTAGQEHYYDSRGIGFRSTASTLTTLSNMTIKNNRIVNMPLSGIRFQCLLTDVEICDNTLINCGSTLDGDYASTSVYRQPISIISTAMNRMDISRNKIVDSNATTRVAYGIFMNKTATTNGTDVNLLDNNIYASGTGFINQINIANVASDPTYAFEPYVRGVIRGFLPTSAVNQKYALGSRVYDPVDGHLFSLSSNQYTWLEDTDTIGNLYATAIDATGITMTAGDYRSILHGGDDKATYFCGGTSVFHGASFQAFGGDASGAQGYAYVITGTHAADRASKFIYSHRNIAGLTEVFSIDYLGSMDTIGHLHAFLDIVDQVSGSPKTVTAAQCKGSILTNLNAVADQEYDLPAAVKGMSVTFYVEVAYKMKLDPNGTDQIMVVTSAAGDFLESDAVIGSYMTLVCLVANKWHVKDFAGVWTEE